MVMDGRGRIVCAACNADLGPSGKPDETNVEDMCEECGKKMLRIYDERPEFVRPHAGSERK